MPKCLWSRSPRISSTLEASVEARPGPVPISRSRPPSLRVSESERYGGRLLASYLTRVNNKVGQAKLDEQNENLSISVLLIHLPGRIPALPGNNEWDD